jgi:hypothetical protein
MKKVYDMKTLTRVQLIEYSKYLGLPASRILPSFYLRKSMFRYFKYIETDDSYLIKGETLTEEEVRDAAWNRGIVTEERTEGEVRERLEKGVEMRRDGVEAGDLFLWHANGNENLEIKELAEGSSDSSST